MAFLVGVSPLLGTRNGLLTNCLFDMQERGASGTVQPSTGSRKETLMARRSTPQAPRSAALSQDQMRSGITKIRRRIAELEGVDITKITRQSHPELGALRTDILSTISDVFGADTVEYELFSPAAHFDTGPVSFNPFGGGEMQTHPSEVQHHVKKSIQSSLGILRSAVKNLEERLEDHTPGVRIPAKQSAAPSRRVFIVHGHDAGPKEAVARFLQGIGFQPIILHEQPNQGRTIIEKFEANADVGFAVVILTPDDPCGGTYRARQNVILELGYFAGALGRNRVCALQKGKIEWPSDVVGVVYTAFDDAGAWKTELAKELQAAKYEIDWNKVMR